MLLLLLSERRRHKQSPVLQHVTCGGVVALRRERRQRLGGDRLTKMMADLVVPEPERGLGTGSGSGSSFAGRFRASRGRLALQLLARAALRHDAVLMQRDSARSLGLKSHVLRA